MAEEPKRPITIFLSYAQKDEALKQEFDDYLAILQQTHLISGLVERRVQPGTDWSQVVDPRLLTAGLFVPLVSPALFASGYAYGAEVREAFERCKTGKMRVIPIILQRVHLAGHPVESFASLPMNGIPILSWRDRAEAWWSIDQGIRTVITQH